MNRNKWDQRFSGVDELEKEVRWGCQDGVGTTEGKRPGVFTSTHGCTTLLAWLRAVKTSSPSVTPAVNKTSVTLQNDSYLTDGIQGKSHSAIT